MSNNCEVFGVFSFYFNNFPYRFHKSFKRSEGSLCLLTFKGCSLFSQEFLILFLDGRKSGIMGFHKLLFVFQSPSQYLDYRSGGRCPQSQLFWKLMQDSHKSKACLDHRLNSRQLGNLVRPCFRLKNKKTFKEKPGLKIQSSGGVLVQHAWGPGFNPKSKKKPKRKTVKPKPRNYPPESKNLQPPSNLLSS